MLIEALFYVFGAILVAASLAVITARNPVYSALALVMCFVTSAAIWLLLEAEFLAVVLVLVYVGAVMVLFLFVVMMLDINLAELRQRDHGRFSASIFTMRSRCSRRTATWPLTSWYFSPGRWRMVSAMAATIATSSSIAASSSG